jgi:hypothetical protein
MRLTRFAGFFESGSAATSSRTNGTPSVAQRTQAQKSPRDLPFPIKVQALTGEQLSRPAAQFVTAVEQATGLDQRREL